MKEINTFILPASSVNLTPGPFPRKEGERGPVVKDKNSFSIERYGAPSCIGKGLGVRSERYGAPSHPGKGLGVRSVKGSRKADRRKGLGVRSEVQLARLYYER